MVRLVIQRVLSSSVSVGGKLVSKIGLIKMVYFRTLLGRGLMVLVGIESSDSKQVVETKAT